MHDKCLSIVISLKSKLTYALGDHIETSVTAHKSPWQIPFYPQESSNKAQNLKDLGQHPISTTRSV